MTIEIFETEAEVGKVGADLVAAYLQQKPDAVLCIASGHSPKSIFKELVSRVASGLDLSAATFIGLDEWEGMNGNHGGSCRHMLDTDFFIPAKISAEQIHFFDGCAPDLEAECSRMNEIVQSFGGIDVMIVGIGLNGHIAMNEPGTSFSSAAHVSMLHESTIASGQKYFESPTKLSRGLTLGLAQFSASKLPILVALGSVKAEAIGKAIKTAPDPGHPASILQLMPDAVVLLDYGAATALQLNSINS